jgi:hypothetical protein
MVDGRTRLLQDRGTGNPYRAYPTGRSLLIMAISSSISVIQRGVTTKTIRQVRRVSTEERCAEAALSSNLIRWTIVGPTSPSLVAFVEGIGGRVLPRNSAPSVALSADGSIVLMGAANDNGGVGAAWVFTHSRGHWTEVKKLAGTGGGGAGNSAPSVARGAS